MKVKCQIALKFEASFALEMHVHPQNFKTSKQNNEVGLDSCGTKKKPAAEVNLSAEDAAKVTSTSRNLNLSFKNYGIQL